MCKGSVVSPIKSILVFEDWSVIYKGSFHFVTLQMPESLILGRLGRKKKSKFKPLQWSGNTMFTFPLAPSSVPDRASPVVTYVTRVHCAGKQV